MQKIYILCGLIGSGKSTWARKFAEDKNVAIICRDDLRSMIKGEYIFEKKIEELVKILATINIITTLSQGWNLIIDETHLTKFKRQEIIELIKAHPYAIPNGVQFNIVYFAEKEKNVVNRMKSPKGLSREVWQSVYEKMLTSFEEPTINELPPGGEIIKPQLQEDGTYKNKKDFDIFVDSGKVD
jgi:predicted kinase